MTVTVNICDQSHDCSIAWEMLVQFFRAKYMTSQVSIHLIFTNIPMILFNFLDILFGNLSLAGIHHVLTGGSGPLLHMARVLIHLWKLQMLISTVILLVKYYTLKQPTDNMSI